ncbi:hypothetical protein MNV49_006104 [Pseudohyphozyma bogoriensis]|nr:hypothetical protein MNV49_006104 [Pseudohyphozyma bogoriensis]
MLRATRTALKATRAIQPAAAAAGVLRPSVLRAAAPAPLRALHASAVRRDVTPLSAKLQEELQYEQEALEPDEPAFLQEFKAEGTWTIANTPGADEVTLTRTFGNENIRVIFSISDLDAEQAEEFAPAENELAEGDEAHHGQTENSFPIEVNITVTKEGKGQGALVIDAVAQDGFFTISNVSHYQDEKLATGLSSEDDWKRQGLYLGPEFENLDEKVQTEFEAYLDERGIDSNLALLIPDLAEYKEQQEYVSWLSKVKGFVEA